MGIVPGVGLILHVGGVDGNAALALLGSLVDAGVVLILGLALERQELSDGGGQGGLAVVDVTDGPSTPPTWSMRPTPGTMPTWTARATPTISRT